MDAYVFLEDCGVLSEMLQQKYFKVYKYPLKEGRRTVDASARTQEPDYKTNILRVSYATARTICCLHADRREYYFDVVTSILNHLNFVEPSTSENHFLLSKSRLDRLRDFSQTGRVGELAQGINYLFTQEVLNFPFIVDYHLFCDRINVKITGKTADFVLLDPYSMRIGLCESKGQAATVEYVVPPLNKAIKQLDASQQNLLLNKSLFARYLHPICTSFRFVKPEVSSINYCDIDSVSATDIVPNDIIRRHYASWFYLVGDFARAELLINGQTISSLDNDPHYYIDDSGIFWVKDFTQLLMSETLTIRMRLGFFKKSNFGIGIHKDFVSLLTIDKIPNQLPVQDVALEGSRQWFRDGTVIETKSK